MKNSKKAIIAMLCLALFWMGLQIDWQGIFSPPQLSCRFCENEVLDLQGFYEGNKTVALLTYKPACEGHVLIIPKRHVERFEELSVEELTEIHQVIQKIDYTFKKFYQTDSYALIQKNGRAAGQSVPHVHFHYLPNKAGHSPLTLGLKYLLSGIMKPLQPEEQKEQVARLQELLARDDI